MQIVSRTGDPATVAALERVAQRIWNKDGRVLSLFEDDKNGAFYEVKMAGDRPVEPWRVQAIRSALIMERGGWNAIHIEAGEHSKTLDPEWVGDGPDDLDDDFQVVEV